MKTERRKAYEKRRNIWRHNVKRSINFGVSVPDVPKVKGWIKQVWSGSYTEVKPGWFTRFINFIKRMFNK